MERLTRSELQTIIAYDAGRCLCGHGELCEVCGRSLKLREFEKLSKRAAQELLGRSHSKDRKFYNSAKKKSGYSRSGFMSK
jgi:hypothetical protein